MYAYGQVLRFVISDELAKQVRPMLRHENRRMNGQVTLTLGNNGQQEDT